MRAWRASSCSIVSEALLCREEDEDEETEADLGLGLLDAKVDEETVRGWRWWWSRASFFFFERAFRMLGMTVLNRSMDWEF